ncbi:2-amino-4-hydroxy-6-hydroxymethyldihydropteridine diphosphokinase [Daejeonella sp.]|uniref:2-amino-4-hydroxy-6- hydroxymethyldihydropteridine diphosphokinase n=1 Tax=Daejeonella sp. TaxID=2805397 RepID=UPI0039832C88
MFIAYLLLGSNLGDSKKHLSDALDLIRLRLGTILKCSSLYSTASWGKHDQPDFLNQVVALKTHLSPDTLLNGILIIETQLGRERNEMWGSRTIDIDILLFGSEIIDQPNLKIPHPFLHKRRFCLQPLCDIAPDLLHPVLGQKVTEMLADLSDNLSVKKLY